MQMELLSLMMKNKLCKILDINVDYNLNSAALLLIKSTSA